MTVLKLFLLSGLLACAFSYTEALSQERREVPEFQVFGAPARPEDANAIAALVDAYKTAWRTQSAESLGLLHAEDVEWINAYARIFRGRKPLVRFLEHRLFPAFEPVVSAEEVESMRAISIRYIAQDAAVVHAYTDGRRGRSRNIDEHLRRTHIHLVIERRGEDWKIVHCAIMDAR